ncbi:transglycosylase domain-containing protein [Roseibium salinum]|nr:transglycosylase domain-containing protein [Roseibium salinum]
MPPYLPNAVVAIEDRRFRSHFGIDPIGLLRAVYTNVTSGRLVQGGSTLTQQLAKNLFLEPDRTLKRKIQELVLAFWLEAEYSKDEILEMYLNRVYLGAGSYGVDAAARRYFGKSARLVTIAEAATMAGLLKAPSRYSPARNPDLAEERAQLVLAAMHEEGYIDGQEAKNALAAPAKVVRRYTTASEKLCRRLGDGRPAAFHRLD